MRRLVFISIYRRRLKLKRVKKVDKAVILLLREAVPPHTVPNLRSQRRTKVIWSGSKQLSVSEGHLSMVHCMLQ